MTQSVDLTVMPLPVLLTKTGGEVFAANEAWVALSGLSQTSSLGRGWVTALDPGAVDGLLTLLDQAAHGSPSLSADYQLVRDGRARWTRWFVRLQNHPDGAVVAMAVIDIHEDRMREAGLHYLATHDHLTGLLNRSEFLESISRALQRQRRNQSNLAVFYVDLDHFKDINDREGHAAGDAILVATGARLKASVRATDLVARLGGDEFGVLCEVPAGAALPADAMAGGIVAALSAGVLVDGDVRPVAATLGVAFLAPSDTPEAVLNRADLAMYRRKAKGRDALPEERPLPARGSAGSGPRAADGL